MEAFNNASYKTMEVNFTSKIVIPVEFSTTTKILAIYVYFKNEFVAEQAIEVYSVFGDNSSHIGTEIYDKCKKRFTVKPSDLFYIDSRNKKNQEMFLSIDNTEALDNTAYVTFTYTASE